MGKEIIETGVDGVQSVVPTQGTDVLMEKTHIKVAELVDILDKQAYLDTGEIKVIGSVVKSEAHESGEFHQAGHVWIYNSKGEVLLQRRSKEKDSYPGLLDISAAGHISAGETMDDGILRELREELGIGDQQIEPIFTHIEDVKRVMRGKDWHNHELNVVYLLRYDGKVEDLKMQKEEVEELIFVPLEQFEQAIQDPEKSKDYVLQRPEYYEKLFKGLKERLKK